MNNGVDIPNGVIAPAQGSPMDAFLNDPMKFKVLQYLLECAMSPSQTVTVTHGTPATSTTIAGKVGLAGQYRYRGWLSRIDQEWVSSCLLGRVNQAGQTRTLDMRGNRPDLGLTAATPGFSLAEATTWGNVFTNPQRIFASTASSLGFPPRFCNSLQDCAPFVQSDCTPTDAGFPESCGMYAFPIANYLPDNSCLPINNCSVGKYQCGAASDACGGTISCGICATNQNCISNMCKCTLTVTPVAAPTNGTNLIDIGWGPYGVISAAVGGTMSTTVACGSVVEMVTLGPNSVNNAIWAGTTCGTSGRCRVTVNQNMTLSPQATTSTATTNRTLTVVVNNPKGETINYCPEPTSESTCAAVGVGTKITTSTTVNITVKEGAWEDLYLIPHADGKMYGKVIFSPACDVTNFPGKSCRIHMTGSNRTINATIVQPQLNLSVGGDDGLVVSDNGLAVPSGESGTIDVATMVPVTLTASAPVVWGGSCSALNTNLISMTSTTCTVQSKMGSDLLVVARLIKTPRTGLTLSVSGSAGSVTSTPAGLNVVAGNTGRVDFETNSAVTLNVGAGVTGAFTGCDSSTSTSCTVALAAARSVSAVLSSGAGGGGGSAAGGGAATGGGGGSSAALSAVAVNPTSIKGGTSVTGTVTLTSAAPSGGATVTLSSSSSTYAKPPTSVVVAAGATTQTFTITTKSTSSNRTATISATYSGSTKSTVLTVTK